MDAGTNARRRHVRYKAPIGFAFGSLKNIESKAYILNRSSLFHKERQAYGIIRVGVSVKTATFKTTEGRELHLCRPASYSPTININCKDGGRWDVWDTESYRNNTLKTNSLQLATTSKSQFVLVF